MRARGAGGGCLAPGQVEQFDQIDTDMQIKQFLEDTRELLRQMIRVVNVQRQDLTRMEVGLCAPWRPHCRAHRLAPQPPFTRSPLLFVLVLGPPRGGKGDHGPVVRLRAAQRLHGHHPRAGAAEPSLAPHPNHCPRP